MRGGDQAEDERTGHHELDEELRAERRQDDEEREDDERCDVPATAAAGGRSFGPSEQAIGAHCEDDGEQRRTSG